LLGAAPSSASTACTSNFLCSSFHIGWFLGCGRGFPPLAFLCPEKKYKKDLDGSIKSINFVRPKQKIMENATTTQLTRFEQIKETEKAVLLRVGIIYDSNATEILCPDGKYVTGRYKDIWVPKSVIKEGQIADWFILKNIIPEFQRNAVLNVIF
jgi:hypothetical protein